MVARLHPLLLVGLLWSTAAHEFIAHVPESSAEEIRASLRTNWTLLTSESHPSPEDLAKISFLVPDYGSSDYSDYPSNKVLQLAYTGYDSLNFSAIPSSWVVAIVHQAGTPIAEYVLMNMLNWNMDQAKVEADFRSCTWKTAPPGNTCKMPPPHKEINGSTLGIVGYGHIGSAIAVRAAAFGMKVCAVDKSSENPPPAPLSWLGDDSQLPRLMRESDFVVLAVPLLPSTQGMINKSNLAYMRNTSVLINIGRGPVADEDSLYNALKERQIGGAILDVWWHPFQYYRPGIGPSSWPASDHFEALDNVVMTPHCSSHTVQSRADANRQIAANMDHFHRGEPLDNVVRNGTTAVAQMI